MGGIYTITNTVNGKKYVGSAVKVPQRWRSHRSELARGVHHSIALQRAWDKHGVDAFSFEVIDAGVSANDLVSREQYWIDKLRAFGPGGYNMCPIAGNCLGRKFTEETKAKMSVSAKARPPISEETRAKLSAAQKAVPAEVRKRIAASNVGRVVTAETRAKLSASNTGKKHTEETRAKLAAIAAGMPQEQRDKISASLRGRPGKKHTAESIEKMSAAKRAGWAAKKARMAGGEAHGQL